MAAPVIVAAGLVKDYGRTHALRGLDLQVNPGEVFGFLGPNGAGKSTTIRVLLDLIRPTAGQVSVLGLDPRRQGVELRRRLGYLEGDFTVDGRQSARELLTYLGRLRGSVPPSRIEAMAEELDLDLAPRIHSLSKGNRQKVGLIQAFMHDPELLILDEPTSGLDPFLQQQFTRMAREAVAAGRTVFMSSHVMSEVQKVADRVGIIRDGLLVTVHSVESLRESSTRRIEVIFADPPPPGTFDGVDGLRDVRLDGPMLHARLDGRADALIKAIAGLTVLSLTSEEPDLEEIFFEQYATGRAERRAS
jgi:ABC-2 type transport system ATP-binding protein